MKRRDDDNVRFRPPEDSIAGTPLWSQSPPPREIRDRDVERLVGIARDLAQKAGRHGVTVSDVRLVAVQRGVLTGQEKGKVLAFLGTLMERAELYPTDRFRRSDVAKSHGNLHRVHVAKDYREGAA